MWETLRNAWKIQELRKKILFTVFMLLIYRFLCFVPTPGVDLTRIQEALKNYSLFGFINSMTGSDMESFTVMAMGVLPYINASIIMQLLTVAIPKLEALQKEGEEGRKKIAQITRYVTVALAFLQALALSIGLNVARNVSVWNYVTIGLCLAAGSAIAMWIGERITEKGIGNGISLLIFAGIISNIAKAVVAQIYALFQPDAIAQGLISIPAMLGVVILSLALIVAVVFIELGERRIPVQYAKRMVGRKMYGGQSTHIPMKINSSGVLPLIFASAIMQFPSTILTFVGPNSQAAQWWNNHVSYTSIWYQLIFALMIFGFTFFYTSITFNPVDISKNLQQNGGMIPGFRQGKSTTDYLARVSSRITLFGAVFLALLATIPTLMSVVGRMNMPFASSSLLIAVSVAIESMRTLESHMTMRHYKGFLR
ncbi:MAG: preprotein translocase subunit SecY [Christensenellales bacterium]|jgi:preprotein translocase subunit SecY